MATEIAPTLPNLVEESESQKKPQRSWRVILYNDNVHAFDDVVLWVQKATGCSLQVAEHVTKTADTTGRSVCYQGGKDDCHKVSNYLRGHGLQVEVDDF